MKVFYSHPSIAKRVFAASVWALCACASLSVAGQTADNLRLLPATGAPEPTNPIEAGLARTLDHLQQHRLKDALVEIDKVIAERPNFVLAHMVKGDLLMARSGRPVALGLTNRPQAAAYEGVLHEARARLVRYLDSPPVGYLPVELMTLGGWQKHALLVDLDRSRVYVFINEGGTPRLVADYYTSIGKNGLDKQREGDQKTPIGVYAVNDSKNKLPDFYGPVAFPINYPNEWDKLAGKTGHGIWLHGVPSTMYARPPRATDGCVVLANEDLQSLNRFIQVGYTPVVITSRSEWQPADLWRSTKADFEYTFEQWLRDWESLNVEAYLAHYSTKFFADGQNFQTWADRKRRVNAGKAFVRVEIHNRSVLSFSPMGTVRLAQTGQMAAMDANALLQSQSARTEPIVVVTFEQGYQSSNLSNKTWKRQYWQRENGVWKILYEGGA